MRTFCEWLIVEARIQQIPEYVLKSIQGLVDGEWGWVKPPSAAEIPSFRYQWRMICEMQGRNVKMEGDKYYLKFFIQCFKKPEWARGSIGYNKKDIEKAKEQGIIIHPSNDPNTIEAPEGYYGGSNWWGSSNSADRYKRELEYGSPFDKVTSFDPKKGHPLVRFAGHLMGWRPGMI